MSEKLKTTLVAFGLCASVILQITGAVFLVACFLRVLEIQSIFDRILSSPSAWQLFLAAVALEVLAWICRRVATHCADAMSEQANAELRDLYRKSVLLDR